jgi:hypothetical protein
MQRSKNRMQSSGIFWGWLGLKKGCFANDDDVDNDDDDDDDDDYVYSSLTLSDGLVRESHIF